MSSAEYAEWQEFYGIDPWGEHRADLRSAHVAYAAFRPHMKGDLSVGDFLFLPEDGPKKIETEEEQWARWDAALDRAAAKSARKKEV